MARKDTIRLYEQGIFKIHIAPTEAQEKLDSGAYEEVFEMRGDMPHFIGIQKKEKTVRPSLHRAAPTITFKESQANVGITKGEVGAPPIRGIVTKAQIKVACWPDVGDTYAVRVGPGGVVWAPLEEVGTRIRVNRRLWNPAPVRA